MPKNPKNIVPGKRDGFTLIELIIVVVIVAILAIVAIPKYYANVVKSQKTQAWANLHLIQQANLAYYAAYGVYPPNNSWPINVTIDGDTIMSVANPSNANPWTYYNYISLGQVYAQSPKGWNCSLEVGTVSGGWGTADLDSCPNGP